MYQKVITASQILPVTPGQVAAFGRFTCPQVYVTGSSPAVYTDEYQLLLTFIQAATNEVETMAATACLNEQILETYDYFPGQQDPRTEFDLTYQFTTNPWWWYGFPTKQSIELVRRPVLVPGGSPITNNVVVNYNDCDGNPQVFSSSNYTVFADKITLNVGCHWPLTDRRQDCIQITYWAGYSESDPMQVDARLLVAVMYLATHFWQVRQIVSVEPTTESWLHPLQNAISLPIDEDSPMRLPKTPSGTRYFGGTDFDTKITIIQPNTGNAIDGTPLPPATVACVWANVAQWRGKQSDKKQTLQAQSSYKVVIPTPSFVLDTGMLISFGSHILNIESISDPDGQGVEAHIWAWEGDATA